MKISHSAKAKKQAPDTSKISTSISLPEFENLPKISSFYKKVNKRCHAFCSDVLPSLYAGNNLFYCVRASCAQKDGILTIKIRVTLSDRQVMRLLYASEQTHIWQEKYQLLIKVTQKQI